MKFQREKLINNKTKYRGHCYKNTKQVPWVSTFSLGILQMASEFWKPTSLFTAGNISCSENSFGFFYRFLRCAGLATQKVLNFRFIKLETLKCVWLGICRAKKRLWYHFVTRRYVIKTNHCELSWQPTASVAKQGQVSFSTFFSLFDRTNTTHA